MKTCKPRAAVLVALATVSIAAGTPRSRAQTAGSLDPTFGNGGTAAAPGTSTVPNLGLIEDLALQPDGKIVGAGVVELDSGSNGQDFGVVRFNADGTLDTTFGGTGTVALNFDVYTDGTGSTDAAYAVAVQPDGKILVAGQTGTTAYHNPNYQGEFIGVARFNADGTLDASFGAGGKVKVRPNNDLSIGASYVGLALQPDGKIVLGGATALSSSTGGSLEHDKFVLVRLDASGAADPAFGSGGSVYTDPYAGTDGTTSSVPSLGRLVLQPDGAVVICGHAFQTDLMGNTTGGGALLRYLPDGTPDTSFGSAGAVIFNAGAGVPADMAYGDVSDVQVEPDGQLICVGNLSNNAFFLARLEPGGAPDTSFGSNGFVADPLAPFNYRERVRRQTDGKYCVGMTIDSNNGDFTLLRFNPDGTLDADFGTSSHGLTLTDFQGGADVSPAMLIQSDGKIVLGGEAYFSPGGGGYAVARYLTASGHPAFFGGEVALSNGVYYLSFPGGNYFGYYSYLSDPHYIYHFDLGYEYVFDAQDGQAGVYLYDFASSDFFYTSPGFPFPYLYDFGLNTVVYYYPDPNNPGRYNTNGVRYFYRFDTGEIFVK